MKQGNTVFNITIFFHLVMPVLDLGWCPGISTMAWQQISYFAIADVEL